MEEEKKRFKRYVYLKRFTDYCEQTDSKIQLLITKDTLRGKELRRNKGYLCLVLIVVVVDTIINIFK